MTRNTLCVPTTIVENLVSINSPPLPVTGFSGNTIHCSPSSTRNPSEASKGDNPGDPLPSDHGDPDPDPDLDPDPPPDQDLEPDQEPVEPPPQLGNSLACSLELLADKIVSIPEASKPKSSIKPRSPDVFNGTDLNKLDIFNFQCSMYMAARPSDFPDQQSRVAFSLSYLKGVPLDWFQGELSCTLTEGEEFLDWFTSYSAFVTELQQHFGPQDPVANATNALELLKYKDSMHYTINFNQHAHRTGWNDVALFHQYYKGLPDRLKDEIARIGKPAKLRLLQDLIATLDQRYWEHQSEISRDKQLTSTANPSTSQNKSTLSDNRNDKMSGNQHTGNSKSNQQHPPKNKDQKKAAPATNTASANSGNKPNNISDLLGPDGKLKPEECQRHMDQNLCLHCSKPSHMVNNCSITLKAKPKGCAATIAPPPPSEGCDDSNGEDESEVHFFELYSFL
jgi:hypothetical protein